MSNKPIVADVAPYIYQDKKYNNEADRLEYIGENLAIDLSWANYLPYIPDFSEKRVKEFLLTLNLGFETEMGLPEVTVGYRYEVGDYQKNGVWRTYFAFPGNEGDDPDDVHDGWPWSCEGKHMLHIVSEMADWIQSKINHAGLRMFDNYVTNPICDNTEKSIENIKNRIADMKDCIAREKQLNAYALKMSKEIEKSAKNFIKTLQYGEKKTSSKEPK
jgi:hypothetical protein